MLVVAALIIWQVMGSAGDTTERPDDQQSPTKTRTQTESPSEPTSEPTEEGIEVDEDDYLGR